ncbi:MAG: T9SS type A sorting domain-containing protein [Chitinophagaceae bacterium]
MSSNSFTIIVPPLSTTAVLLKADKTVPAAPAGESVVIYPNPVNDKLQVIFDFTIGDPTEMIAYNLVGQRIRVFTVTSDRRLVSAIDVNAFSAGLYFLSVKNSRYRKTIPFIITQQY